MVGVPLCLSSLVSLSNMYWEGIGWVKADKEGLIHLISKSEHDSVLITLVRHPRVPGSKVSQHDISFVTNWLDGWPALPSFFSDLIKQICRGFSYNQVCIREVRFWPS